MLLEGLGSVQGDSEVPWAGAWQKGITIDMDDKLLAGFLGVQVEWGGSCFCLAETQAPSFEKQTRSCTYLSSVVSTCFQVVALCSRAISSVYCYELKTLSCNKVKDNGRCQK